MKNELLPPNAVLNTTALTLELSAMPPEREVAGQSRVGAVPLAVLGGCEVGIWELTPGTSTDVEIDEVFVVLAGEATVAFDDGTPALRLYPGAIGRLAAGARTTWTVTETLRKVYLA
ncbi:cupin domain-containing protein [Pelomonas sp. KK5]|uniref:cupin domain-containing protein n=1 Tax=Pelomonas sp. KK5 TaxID=1855730 RepID=UPI00097C6CB5|nr:cupin domain-containing protein [Pelomonas sp. KK5]